MTATCCISVQHRNAPALFEAKKLFMGHPNMLTTNEDCPCCCHIRMTCLAFRSVAEGSD